MKDSTEYYAYVEYRTSGAHKLAKITSSTKSIQFYNLPISGGSLEDSIFISATSSYYIGKLSSISTYTPTKSFSNSIGYLMSFDLSLSCLFTHTYTLSAAISMTNNILTFGTTAATNDNHDSYGSSSSTLTVEADKTN